MYILHVYVISLKHDKNECNVQYSQIGVRLKGLVVGRHERALAKLLDVWGYGCEGGKRKNGVAAVGKAFQMITVCCFAAGNGIGKQCPGARLLASTVAE